MGLRERTNHPEQVQRRRWYTLLVLCLSLMVIGLDNTILNVALPTLARQHGGLGATASQLQWIVDAYTIVFAGLLLTAGSLGDRFGRYKALALGLSIFGAGSLASAFSGSATALIATRSVMGIGGAFIMPSTLSILTNVFTNPLERGKAIGIWAGVSAAGIGVGPLAGGFLLSHFWWGSVLLVNVPIVIAALVLGFLFVPDSRDPSAPKLDPFGALLSIAGLGTLLWAVIEGPTRGWSNAGIMGAFAAGVLILAAFLLWELNYSSPMLDIRVFENPRFSAASGAITLTFLALFGTLFLMTQYFQAVLGYSTLKAGAVFLPQAGVMMVFAPLSSVWVRKFGNKVVVAGGLSLVALTMLSFTALTPGSHLWEVIAITMLLGLGMANVMAPATDSIMGSLPRAKAGVGSAVNDTTRQVGGAVGVAVLGSVLASRYSPSIASALAGKVPAPLVAAARNSIGTTLTVANSAAGRPYARVLLTTGRASFVSGLHVAAIIAAAFLALAVTGVIAWLPARARDEEAVPVALDGVPTGIGPVDVVPAAAAADVAGVIDAVPADAVPADAVPAVEWS